MKNENTIITLSNGKTVDTSVIDGIFVKHLGSRISLKAEVMVHQYGEKEIKFINFTDMSRDANVLALPALGVKHEERVRLVSKGDSAKSKFRRDNLAVSKIKSAVNDACRGMKWSEFCELMGQMYKWTYAKNADGKRERTGIELRYQTVRSTDADLKFMQKYIFKDVQQYLKGIAYSEKKSMSAEDKAKAKAEQALAKARELLAKAEESAKSVGLTA